MKTQPLVIRCSDHAIFEKSGGPCRENPPLFCRLEWKPYKPFHSWNWKFGGRLVRSGELWQPPNDYDYEFVARHLVIAGCRELARANGNSHE